MRKIRIEGKGRKRKGRVGKGREGKGREGIDLPVQHIIQKKREPRRYKRYILKIGFGCACSRRSRHSRH